jgi:hypothetical protein
MLRVKCAYFKSHFIEQKNCILLVFDEMAIRQHVEYDGRDYFGSVAMGGCLNVSQ